MKVILLIFLSFPFVGNAQDTDKRAVYNAALDYIEGMYQADPARIKKCVHPDVIKQGYYWKGRTREFSNLTSVSFDQIVQIAYDWNRSEWLPEDAPKEVTIFDVQEKIANVKVTAYWGVDYIQLSKIDGEWMIMQILWQNWPKFMTGQQNDQ